MAGIKISQLPAVPSALLTDFFPVVQGGVTSQETLAQVATLFGFSGDVLSLQAGGTGANLTASNYGLVYSTSSELAILSTTGNGILSTNSSSAPSINDGAWLDSNGNLITQSGTVDSSYDLQGHPLGLR